ncbi:hypothetical protein ACFQ3Z_07450 [Streptomyces nogalater]
MLRRLRRRHLRRRPGRDPDGLPTFDAGLRAARLTQAVLDSAASHSTWTEIPA